MPTGMTGSKWSVRIGETNGGVRKQIALTLAQYYAYRYQLKSVQEHYGKARCSRAAIAARNKAQEAQGQPRMPAEYSALSCARLESASGSSQLEENVFTNARDLEFEAAAGMRERYRSLRASSLIMV